MYNYTLLSVYTTIYYVLFITGILNLFCTQEVISQVNSGRIITEDDISITEDDTGPLVTESAWSLLNDEGTHTCISKHAHMW